MKVEIDPGSGFCGGVIRAIRTCEEYLSSGKGPLFSLGAIVHNEEEMHRLSSLGLETIDSLDVLTSAKEPLKGRTVLFRAHGEPPKVYARARAMGLEVIDCTCPVVLALQKAIREAYAQVSPAGGSLAIFGKTGHPEVMGLVGQLEVNIPVFQSLEQARQMVRTGILRLDRNLELFSQTTMSPSEYGQVCSYLSSNMQNGATLNVHNSICSQVATRHQKLIQFASLHDVIVFVSGLESSNGKVLYELCRGVNPSSYHITSCSELRREWFRDQGSVGVCGATSTPKWLLEQVAEKILSF